MISKTEKEHWLRRLTSLVQQDIAATQQDPEFARILSHLTAATEQLLGITGEAERLLALDVEAGQLEDRLEMVQAESGLLRSRLHEVLPGKGTVAERLERRVLATNPEELLQTPAGQRWQYLQKLQASLPDSVQMVSTTKELRQLFAFVAKELHLQLNHFMSQLTKDSAV